MRFEAEGLSSYFRRSLVSLGARLGDQAAADRLEALVGAPLDSAAIDRLLAEELADAALTIETGLRRARQWLMLGLIERDVRGAASLEEVCDAMTAFAGRATAQAMRDAAT